MIINFELTKDGFRCTDAPVIALVPSINYLIAKFNIDEPTWNGVKATTAIFKSATYNETIEVLLDSNNRCFIDPEIYRRGGTIQVKLVGDRYVDGRVISSSNVTDVIEFYIKEDIITPTRTPSNYDVFVAELLNAEEAVEEIVTTVQTKLDNGEFDGEDGADGVGIDNITYNSDGTVEITLSDGTTFTSDYSMKGEQGDTGVGIAAVDFGEDGTVVVTLTDGTQFVSEYSMKGDRGDDGSPAGFGTVTASVDANVGTPEVTVTTSGSDTAKNFAFAFKNLKGVQGERGLKGDKGDPGEITMEQLQSAFIRKSMNKAPVLNFTDGANDIPVNDLVTDIEPVQDLHGYDKPWAGGNGKNKLRYPYSNSSGTYSGVSVTVNSDGTITLNGTTTTRAIFYVENHNDSFDLSNGQYIATCDGISNDCGLMVETYDGSTWVEQLAQIRPIVPSGQFTIDHDGYDRVSVYLYINSGVVLNNVTIKPMIRLASETDASFAPYSNICPISGWGEVKVVNMSDTDKVQFFNGLLNGTYGFVDLGTLNWNYVPNWNGHPAHTVALSTAKGCGDDVVGNFICPKYTSMSRNQLYALDGSGMSINPTKSIAVRDYTYTSASAFKTAMSGVYLVYELATPTTPTITKAQFDMLLEQFDIGGQLYTIDLDGTRYGGTLDVTSGVLTVTKAEVDLGTLNWVKQNITSGHYRFRVADYTPAKKPVDPYTVANIICSNYEAIDSVATWNATKVGIAISVDPEILVYDTNYTTAEAFKTAMSDVYLVYELATPITVQLTPTEVNTLLGTNHVWADSGESEIDYYADATIVISDLTNALLALGGNV